MANTYVRSTDGNDSDNGSTWALAKATLAGAAAIDAAGDTVWVSQAHAESGAALSWTWNGTTASPVRILCGNDAAEPPTALATTATVTASGLITVGGTGDIYVYGITFVAGSTAFFANTACTRVWESCSFQTSGGSGLLTFGGNSAVTSCTRLINCTFKQSLDTTINLGGRIEIIGGSWLSGGTNVTNCFKAATGTARVEVTGFDFSNCAAGVNLADPGAIPSHFVFRYCKLPASWSGKLLSTAGGAGSFGHGTVAELHSCDSGATTYRYRRETQYGTVVDEETIVRSGGASDGTTTISWKMFTDASHLAPTFPFSGLTSGNIYRRNTSTGASKTATIEILIDSATPLTDGDIALRLIYLGSSSSSLGSVLSSAKADILASASNLTSSAASWATTGMTNPNAYKLQVAFTPQLAGYLIAEIVLYKSSATVYVDPKIDVS